MSYDQVALFIQRGLSTSQPPAAAAQPQRQQARLDAPSTVFRGRRRKPGVVARSVIESPDEPVESVLARGGNEALFDQIQVIKATYE